MRPSHLYDKKYHKFSGKKCAKIGDNILCQEYGLSGVCVYFLYFSRLVIRTMITKKRDSERKGGVRNEGSNGRMRRRVYRV